MFARVCVTTVVLILAGYEAHAETIQCTSFDQDRQPEYAFHISAEKTGVPQVWFAFDPAELMQNPSEVLHHFYTGMEGSNGLGASTITIRQRDENGELMMPAMVVVDWTRARLAVSYVPFLSFNNLLVIRDDFDCGRLD